jgi:hypothetical protein
MKRTLVLLGSLLTIAASDPLPLIAHNDGTVEQLKVGQRAAFAGMIPSL